MVVDESISWDFIIILSKYHKLLSHLSSLKLNLLKSFPLLSTFPLSLVMLAFPKKQERKSRRKLSRKNSAHRNEMVEIFLAFRLITITKG